VIPAAAAKKKTSADDKPCACKSWMGRKAKRLGLTDEQAETIKKNAEARREAVAPLREKLKNLIIEKMPLESGAFLRAILLGDRSELPKQVTIKIKALGCAGS